MSDNINHVNNHLGAHDSLMKMCREDEIIMREGETYDEMYKVLSGKVAMYLHYGEENEYLIGIISDQRCIGDVSLFTGEPSPYTAVALSNVMLMRIKNSQFEEFIVNNTKNAVDIMKNMANIIMTLNKDIDLIIDELTDYVDRLNSLPDIPELPETLNVNTIRRRIMQYKMATITGEANPI